MWAKRPHIAYTNRCASLEKNKKTEYQIMNEIENINIDDFLSIGGLMVSKLITEKGNKPMFMYREKRTRNEDSGWRIFSGFETDEYLENHENIGIYNPSTILKMDSSIQNLLLKGVGSVYERKDEKSEWYKVDDYELEDDFIVEHLITEEWTIEINNLFERRKEENGDLLYTTGDKSVRVAIWNFDQTKNEIYQDQVESIENRDESESVTLSKYEFSDLDISRIGYKIRENDESKSYDVIYGFSIVDKEIIQLAFYFDNQEDESWAIETWKNIKKKTRHNNG